MRRVASVSRELHDNNDYYEGGLVKFDRIALNKILCYSNIISFCCESFAFREVEVHVPTCTTWPSFGMSFQGRSVQYSWSSHRYYNYT